MLHASLTLIPKLHLPSEVNTSSISMFGFASSLSISFRRGILPNNVGQQHRHVFKSARTQQASRFSMAATSPPGPVGFIGLGVMGLPMAANIANKYNAEMVVWNRSPNRAEELLDAVNDPKLITIAPTPAAVVQECSVTYSMLSTPAASRAVLHDGENAALDALTTGKGFVDCSTLTESDMLATAAKVKSQGARFLEAPVSGSLGPAVQGTLIFLCAGDKTLYDEVTGALDVMGKRSVFLGVTGAGTRMKLVVNQIMGAALAALAEGIALSEAVDLRVEDLLSVL